MSESIRVMLCDDHALLRAGLRALLNAQPDIDVVGEAGSGEETVNQVTRLSPSVVLMDISLPGIDGLEATRRILDALPGCRVLVLTMHKRLNYLLDALKIGASGYVLKSDLDTELVRAIRSVHQGNVFVYSSDARLFFQHHLERGESVEGQPRLSEMEGRVLTLTVQGQTGREIAQALNISPSTVDTYRSRIMNKLGIQRRAELVHWALEQGLLPQD